MQLRLSVLLRTSLRNWPMRPMNQVALASTFARCGDPRIWGSLVDTSTHGAAYMVREALGNNLVWCTVNVSHHTPRVELQGIGSVQGVYKASSHPMRFEGTMAWRSQAGSSPHRKMGYPPILGERMTEKGRECLLAAGRGLVGTQLLYDNLNRETAQQAKTLGERKGWLEAEIDRASVYTWPLSTSTRANGPYSLIVELRLKLRDTNGSLSSQMRYHDAVICPKGRAAVILTRVDREMIQVEERDHLSVLFPALSAHLFRRRQIGPSFPSSAALNRLDYYHHRRRHRRLYSPSPHVHPSVARRPMRLSREAVLRLDRHTSRRSLPLDELRDSRLQTMSLLSDMTIPTKKDWALVDAFFPNHGFALSDGHLPRFVATPSLLSPSPRPSDPLPVPHRRTSTRSDWSNAVHWNATDDEDLPCSSKLKSCSYAKNVPQILVSFNNKLSPPATPILTVIASSAPKTSSQSSPTPTAVNGHLRSMSVLPARREEYQNQWHGGHDPDYGNWRRRGRLSVVLVLSTTRPGRSASNQAPSAGAMSQVPSTSTSTNFETIFTAAFEAYKRQTKRDITSHPLAIQLRSCDSPSAILAVLRTQVQTFDRSLIADERWKKWLDPTVNVLYAFSVALGNGVGLIFPPSNAIFAGIGILLQAVKDVRSSENAVKDLFGRLEYFFKRLEKYIEVRPTAAMADIIVKIMVEVLSILGTVTQEIGQGRTKKYLKK
ncbi:hypothetical protein H4582DRAFT_2128753, partial [Lactarius indigo]